MVHTYMCEVACKLVFSLVSFFMYVRTPPLPAPCRASYFFFSHHKKPFFYFWVVFCHGLFLFSLTSPLFFYLSPPISINFTIFFFGLTNLIWFLCVSCSIVEKYYFFFFFFFLWPSGSSVYYEQMQMPAFFVCFFFGIFVIYM